jgi:iron complex outermembrane receptor protein
LQFEADSRQAGTNAQLFNTRKSVRQHQLGGIWRLESGRAHWTVVAHTGNRKVVQFLATPVAAQSATTSSGGVVDLDRGFAGASARMNLEGGNWQWTLGMEAEASDETRQGFNNFSAVGTLGVAGELRRNESTRVNNVDLYSQAAWTLSEWRLLAGARVSRLGFRLRDRFVALGNPDDSGQLRFRATTPTVGILRPLGSGLSIYASAGRGFETPTTVELAYRPDGLSGFNTTLAAGRSRHAEVGLKWRDGSHWRADLALYRVQTDNEIVPATNAGGRTTFQNGGRTARHGAELSARWRPDSSWQLALAASHIRAEFRDGFRSTTTANNTVTTRIVEAGNALPGVPAQQWFAELTWRPNQAGWSAALDLTRRSRIWADDRNSFAISGATWANARLLHRGLWQGMKVESFLRMDNITDRRYAGSVIVNEANDRFVESAPGRSVSLGITLQL